MSDLRYAIRQLARHPGFTAVAVITLALGIGANTAIFSVVHGVLLRPLPYPEPDRLVTVWETNPGPGWSERNLVTSGSYLDWRDRATSFAALGAYSLGFGVAAMTDDEPVELNAVRVTPSVFEALGANARLGRALAPEDGEPGGEPVVLLSHGTWRDRFGSDPAIVGREIQLEEQSFTVVGVMPGSFDFPTANADLWIPIRFDAADRESRQSHRWRVIGRLGPGVSVEQARADMEAIAAQLREEHPRFMEGWSVTVVSYHGDLVRASRPLLLILFGVVAVFLLIACANIANLFLARAIGRERELALRAALGGTRWRLVRQLLTEAGALAVLGVVGGMLLGVWGVGVLRALAPPDIPLLENVGLNAAVLAYVAGVAALATLMFGLVPAWRVSRPNLEAPLKGARGATGARRHTRLRAALLVGELALSMILLVGAGLLVRSFQQLQTVDHGFEPEGLLAVSLLLPHSRYGGQASHDAFYASAIEELTALPGVVAVAGTTEPPVVGFNNTFSFVIEGRPAAEPSGREQPVEVPVVTPGFFATMGIPLIEGRTFTHFDRADQPGVVVVNRAFARRFWPGESAVGKRIGFDDHDGPWLEVVGVVGDLRQRGLDQPLEPAMYMPHAQKRWGWMSWLTLMVRTRGDPPDVAGAVRQTIWSLDDRLPIRELTPVTRIYAESSARRRFAATLTGGFAAVALFLALFGIFGVVSYTVAQREREIGVRMALGAESRGVLLGVLRQGLVIAAIGVALGAAGALLLTRLMQSLLFGVTATDPVTFTAMAFLLVTVALLASWLPARRAARIDPMEALRHE